MTRAWAQTFKSNLILGISVLFFLAAISIHSQLKRPDIKVSKQDSAYTLNSTFLRMISLGNKRVFSNVLWIQTLMESDQEKYKGKDFADWMYLRFLTISVLDPKFYENYLYGGMYLSVIKDDLEGAATIFEKGLEQYPNDYRLIYYAGFNYYFEMGDFERGYGVLKKLSNHEKTPLILKQIINKLQFEVTGDYDLALSLLIENYKVSNDERIKAKLAADIYAIKADRDIACLNSGKQNCNLVDARGNRYIKSSEGWKAAAPYKPYKIFRKSSK